MGRAPSPGRTPVTPRTYAGGGRGPRRGRWRLPRGPARGAVGGQVAGGGHDRVPARRRCPPSPRAQVDGRNCIGPCAPATDVPRIRPIAVSTRLMAARYSQPHAVRRLRGPVEAHQVLGGLGAHDSPRRKRVAERRVHGPEVAARGHVVTHRRVEPRGQTAVDLGVPARVCPELPVGELLEAGHRLELAGGRRGVADRRLRDPELTGDLTCRRGPDRPGRRRRRRRRAGVGRDRGIDRRGRVGRCRFGRFASFRSVARGAGRQETDGHRRRQEPSQDQSFGSSRPVSTS